VWAWESHCIPALSPRVLLFFWVLPRSYLTTSISIFIASVFARTKAKMPARLVAGQSPSRACEPCVFAHGVVMEWYILGLSLSWWRIAADMHAFCTVFGRRQHRNFFFYIHTMCQARYYYYGRSHCLVAKPCCVTRCNAPVNPTQRGSAPDSRAGKNGGGLLCFPGACVSGGPGLSSLSGFHFGSGFYKGPLPLFSEVIKCKRKEKRAPEETSSRFFFSFQARLVKTFGMETRTFTQKPPMKDESVLIVNREAPCLSVTDQNPNPWGPQKARSIAHNVTPSTSE